MEEKKRENWPEIKIALEYSNSIIATLREPFLVLDKNLRIISANHSFFNTFKVAPKDTIGQMLPDLGNRQWNIPKLLHLLREILPEKRTVENYEIEHEFECLGKRWMSLNASRLRIPRKIAAAIAATVIKEAEEVEEEELILLAIEDITERRRLQIELKDSEERFHAAFQTSQDALLLIHKSTAGILNSNRAAQELLGYSSDEFLKKKLWDIGVVKDSGEFQNAVRGLEKDGVIRYKELSVKDRESLGIKAEVFLVDRAKVIQCNLRDITERKAAEAAVQEEKRKAQEYLDIAGTMLVAIDVRGTVTLINKKGCEILGCEQNEVIGKNWFENFIPERNRKEVSSVFHRLMTGEVGLFGYFENLVLVKDNEEKLVGWYNTVLKDKAGRAVGTLSSGEDITIQREREKTLRASEEKYRNLYEGSHDGYVVVDLKGNILECNHIYRDMVGYSDEELKKLTYIDLTPPKWRAPEKDIVEHQVMPRGYSDIYQKEYIRKDGTVFPVELRTYLMRDEAGNPTMMWAFIRDITERKSTEEKIKATIDELRHFKEATVDRENRIIELKEEVSRLSKELKRKEPYGA